MDYRIIEELVRSDGFYTINKLHIRFFNSMNLAIMWAELLELQNISRYKANSDVFPCTYDFISQRTKITNYQIRKFILILKLKGLLSTRRDPTGKIFYKINTDEYLKQINEFLNTENSSTNNAPVEIEFSEDCNDIHGSQADNSVESAPVDFNSYINKESKSKVVSKETTDVGTAPTSSVVLNKRAVTKPMFVKRKPSIFPSKEVEILFTYWNDLEYPIPNHQTNPHTKLFQEICKRLTNKLKKYTVEQIKQSMDNYRKLLLEDRTVLKLTVPGIIVGLADFFCFNIYTDKALARIKELDGVDCWFDECIQGWDYLINKYGVCVADENPEVTKEIAKLYREKINPNQLTRNEINIMIRAAAKLVNFHNNMKSKLNFSSCPLEKESPRLFAHHMIEAIILNTPDLSIVKVQWLATDNHFNNRMVDYFKKRGMLEREHHGSNLDMLSEEMKAQQKKEYKAVMDWKNNEIAMLNQEGNPANSPERRAIKEEMIRKMDAITDKYKVSS